MLQNINKKQPQNFRKYCAFGFQLYFFLWIVFPFFIATLYIFSSRENNKVTLLYSNNDSSLSPYDRIIQKYSEQHSIDWRLIASIVFIESSFQPHAISSAGAQGLMQLMPIVAQEHNIKQIFHPEENIRTGIRHFVNKMSLIRGKTLSDTLKLGLVAYNVGLGHLRDAQNLAIQLNKDPRKWIDIKETIVLLEDPKYFQQARYGYIKGKDVLQYVEKVLNQYRLYKTLYPTTSIHLSDAKLLESDKPIF